MLEEEVKRIEIFFKDVPVHNDLRTLLIVRHIDKL